MVHLEVDTVRFWSIVLPQEGPLPDRPNGTKLDIRQYIPGDAIFGRARLPPSRLRFRRQVTSDQHIRSSSRAPNSGGTFCSSARLGGSLALRFTHIFCVDVRETRGVWGAVRDLKYVRWICPPMHNGLRDGGSLGGSTCIVASNRFVPPKPPGTCGYT